MRAVWPVEGECESRRGRRVRGRAGGEGEGVSPPPGVTALMFIWTRCADCRSEVGQSDLPLLIPGSS